MSSHGMALTASKAQSGILAVGDLLGLVEGGRFSADRGGASASLPRRDLASASRPRNFDDFDPEGEEGASERKARRGKEKGNEVKA